MREIVSLPSWRLPHWLILIGAALYASVYVGLIPPPQTLLSWLASRPGVATAFQDPNFGRADALILMFGTLFFAPFALVIALVFLIFALAILGGLVLPVVRWFGLPDWLATAMALLTVVVVAYTERGAWVPKSLWLLGVLARACLVVLA